MRRSHVVVMLMTVLAAASLSPRADAESKYKACSLLTAAELGTALNAHVVNSQDSDVIIPNGPYKGETMSGCNWAVGSAYVTLNVIRGPRTPEERAGGLAGLRRVEEVLKNKGWTIEAANIPGADCNSYKPPAGQSNLPPGGAACVMVSKGLAFWLGVNGPVTAQQVKALADKVAARLP
jgi:hypothetical protein